MFHVTCWYRGYQSLQWPGRAFGFPFLARIEMSAFPTVCRPVLVPIQWVLKAFHGDKASRTWSLPLTCITYKVWRWAMFPLLGYVYQCPAEQVPLSTWRSGSMTDVPTYRRSSCGRSPSDSCRLNAVGVFAPQRCGNSPTDKCMPWYYSALQVPQVSLIVIGWFRNWEQPVSCNVWGYEWYDPSHWLPSYALVSRRLCCWPVGCT